jgi:hypothetical protein
MDYDAMVAKAKSANMKKWLRQLQAGSTTKAAITGKLAGYIAEMPTKNTAADVEEHLAKYYDGLMFMPILKGDATPTSANIGAQVSAARNSFTRRVKAKKEERQSESRARSVSRARSASRGRSAAAGPRSEIEKAASKANKTNKTATRRAQLNRISAKYGRKAGTEKAETIAAAIEFIKAGDSPKYMIEWADDLESQLLRYSAKDKLRVKSAILAKINELDVNIDEREAARLITPKMATETRGKLEKLRMLLAAAEEETNVELSPESKAIIAPPTALPRMVKRTYHVGSEMTCAVLRHPCNPKIKLTKEQLQRATQQIMKNDHALREEGFPGTTKDAASPASVYTAASAAAAAPSARGRSRAPRSDGAAAGAGGPQSN